MSVCVYVYVGACLYVFVCDCMQIYAYSMEQQYVGRSSTPHMTIMYAQPVTKKQLMTPNQQVLLYNCSAVAANGDPG